MRAAVYETSGDSGVLQVREVPTPTPGPGEVLVRIALAGVNPTDWKNRRATAPRTAGLDFQIPGQDGAGTIEAVGAGVDARRIGERVWLYMAARGRQWGTAAEYSVIPAQRAVPLADSASWELGASLGVPALTAWYCLNADRPIGTRADGSGGQRVLVAGGAGAVGHAAVELARWGGAEVVIATASTPEKRALATAAGAHLVVDYRSENAASEIRSAAPEGVDRIVELALQANMELDLAVAAPYALIVVYADDVHPVASVPIRRLMLANLTLRFMILYAIREEKRLEGVAAVQAAVAAQALTPLPIERVPLQRVADAHDLVQEGAGAKKVVVDLR
jgi:NADPH:quinone reductase